jgi:hypothetical protein
MSEFQTAEEFGQYLNTPFRLQVNAPKPIDITLVGVESRPLDPTEEAGMERFSVFFSSPLEFLLPQGTYRVTHPQMGEFDLFLVAVGQEADGYRYEAVYNYYKADGAAS